MADYFVEGTRLWTELPRGKNGRLDELLKKDRKNEADFLDRVEILCLMAGGGMGDPINGWRYEVLGEVYHMREQGVVGHE